MSLDDSRERQLFYLVETESLEEHSKHNLTVAKSQCKTVESGKMFIVEFFHGDTKFTGNIISLYLL